MLIMKTVVLRKEQRESIQNKVKFSIYLPPAMLAEIKRNAKAESRTISQQVIFYLKQHVAYDDGIPEYATKAQLETQRLRR